MEKMECLLADWIDDLHQKKMPAYCQKENLAFKILLLLDNASAHKLDYEALCRNVSVLFLPPNTTSLLQPMDQSVKATFKAYYLRRMFSMLIKETADAVHSFVGFDAIPTLQQEIIKLTKNVGSKEVEEEDVEELLESHAEELTNEELIELDQQRIS
ncbi:unnamed protein product [Caretta caretta]